MGRRPVLVWNEQGEGSAKQQRRHESIVSTRHRQRNTCRRLE